MLESYVSCVDSIYDYSDYSEKIHRVENLANAILADIMKFRRAADQQTSCMSSSCQKCNAPHLTKVISAIKKNLPITFVLPAFPGKSPNPAKVLGTLPDMAEKRALKFLQYICDRIKDIYSPGARIILCSDGRVFSDVVGMRDEDVTAYQREISNIITELNLTSISTFDLDDLYEGLSFNQMRERLMCEYGEPLELLKAAISRGGKISENRKVESKFAENTDSERKNNESTGTDDDTEDDKEANRLYCGITRFLVEDSLYPGQTRSRTSIQKECRLRAYSVIQRSKAWGDWVEAQFPEAVRLSIHPQTCGAKKLGIRLIEPDHWLTPWHSVAVEISDGKFILLKRAQAEELGARLVYEQGRPSHYVLEKKHEVECGT